MTRTSADLAARDALVDRWTQLTREILPGMAAAFRWPIRLDHCFMRVCLDTALGARWDTVVRRPAIQHLSDAQLARAVAQAEAITARPDLLSRLNQDSLSLRGRGRSSTQASPTPRHEAGPARVLRSP